MIISKRIFQHKRLKPIMVRSRSVEWKYYEVIEVKGNGVFKVKCKECTQEFCGSLTRLRGHLLGNSETGVGACHGISEEKLRLLKIEVNEKGAKKSLKRSHAATVAKISAASCGTEKVPNSIKSLWCKNDKHMVDRAVAKYFYAEGIPFNKARSPFFTDMVSSIARFGTGYRPPSSESLRTVLLDEERNSVHAELVDVRSTWEQTGCTIVSDGWTDRRGRPLINILICSPAGNVFHSTKDASGQEKTGAYIAHLLEGVIDSIGPEHVVQVVTDNAANCKSAGEIIMGQYPNICWTPCAAHCMNLMLHDIGKIPMVKETVQKVRDLITFIKNHSITLALFRSYCKANKCNELSKPADTRFATEILALRSVLHAKPALKQTVVSTEWETWLQQQKRQIKENGAAICRYITGGESDAFWNHVTLICRLTRPLMKVLRLVDGDEPCIGDVYESLDCAKEEMARSANRLGVDNGILEEFWSCVDARWEFLHRPIYAAACILNPRMFRKGHEKDAELMKHFYECLDKMVPNIEKQALIRQEYRLYMDAKGLFALAAAREDRSKVAAATWWACYGASTPNLQEWAIRILSQVCSASACERTWGVFDIVHEKKRNKLTSSRLTDLVFVHTNLRLIKRRELALPADDPLLIEWDQHEEDENDGAEEERTVEDDNEVGNASPTLIL